MAASLLHYTAPQTCGSAGLAGHGESAPAAWLGSEAESSQGHKRQGCEERETATKMRGREETRAGALLPVRAAVKAGVCQGGSGRRAHPGTRGAWEAGAACARQAHLNIRLCHTRGAADNFITSADKNDCGRMQMASPSRCLPPLGRRLRAGPRAAPPPPRAPRPAPDTPAPHPLPRARRSAAGARPAHGSRKGTRWLRPGIANIVRFAREC